MTQNAVDWFFEQAVKLLKNPDDIESLNMYHFVAKQIFKDQIIEAHIFAHLHYGGGITMPSEKEFEEFAEQYYQQAYEDNK